MNKFLSKYKWHLAPFVVFIVFIGIAVIGK